MSVGAAGIGRLGLRRQKPVDEAHDVLDGCEIARNVVPNGQLVAVLDLEHEFQQVERIHSESGQLDVRRHALSREIELVETPRVFA